jgi:protoporphyrinogen IX oxidase
MAILILKALHFIGYIIWFAGLFYVVSHIYKIYFLKNDTSKDTIPHYLLESGLDTYRKIANPAMMFTWTAGLIMIYLYGMEWFRINLWIHQKIALLILLTVYHVYCKILLLRVMTDTTTFAEAYIRIFGSMMIVFPVLIIITAVFRALSPAVTGSMVLAALIAVIYFSARLFRKKAT